MAGRPARREASRSLQSFLTAYAVEQKHVRASRIVFLCNRRQDTGEEEDSLTMKNYADAVAFLGQWGRFQQMVFFLLCASIMPNGFGAFTLVFVNDIPTHHCLIPDVNLSRDWRSAIIPVQVSAGCSIFAFKPNPVLVLMQSQNPNASVDVRCAPWQTLGGSDRPHLQLSYKM